MVIAQTQNRVITLDGGRGAGEVISQVAESVGFASLVMTTASQFFRELASCNPSHIVLDLMSGMEGIEILAELERRNCQASIIIVSGIGYQVLDAAFCFGIVHGLVMKGVLSKPLSPVRLCQLLDIKDPDARTAGDDGLSRYTYHHPTRPHSRPGHID